MNSFEYTSALQYRVKAQAQQIEEFKSGERYTKLEREYKAVIRSLNKRIQELEAESSRAHSETVTVRNIWSEAMDDLDREHKKEPAEKDRYIAKLEARLLEALRRLDAALDKCREKQQEIYALGTELEEERALNKKLTAQVNRDFENSSIPSSLQGPGKKKIPNSRVKTGRRPGGQPGHEGHRRKRHMPTETHELPVPEEYADNPDYYETGKMISKQKFIIGMSVKVIEYTAREYRSHTTGARVHALFPDGYVVNEVNYDGTVKALAFLLSNECNVSHAKIRKLLSELTDGEVEISDGMINSLCV